MTDWTVDGLDIAPPDRRPVDGPIRIGSDAHKVLFCRMLLETFNPYKPAVIDWPRLTDEARARLVSLPIWIIAVQTEGKASLRVRSYVRDVAEDAWLRKRSEERRVGKEC